jgi:predicted regulator of Ras-like GTPase activity (Roadblock/LC7/MglB family)
MTDNDFSDFFVSDADEEAPPADDGVIRPPVVVPTQPSPAPAPTQVAETPSATGQTPSVAAPTTEASPAGSVAESASSTTSALLPEAAAEPQVEIGKQTGATVPRSDSRAQSREGRLAEALKRLMEESQDIEAAALVSLDGFTMASALPQGMQEDRVGAMSAAILGLGERAAVELGKGKLSQVFIEGDGGYVMLIAAGDRAVLTCLADQEAKLGLVLYDMRLAAQSIGEILG